MLTYVQLRALKPKDKIYDITVSSGLQFRVTPAGKKYWRLHKRVNGKYVIKTLGTFPEMSIKEAETMALGITEVSAERSLQSKPFSEIFAEWYAIKRTRIINHNDILRRFENYLLPKFANRAFDELTPVAVISHIKASALFKEGKLETIRRLCSELKQVEIYAMNCGYIDALRLQGIEQAFMLPTEKHFPSIKPSELVTVLPELQAAALKAPTTWVALQIGFYTLLRPREYCSMRWDWIHGDVIEVPAALMKMKRAFTVPISTQLQKVLDYRPKVTDFVLTSPDKPNQPIAIETSERFLRQHGFRGRLVPHGIRSIGRTWMEENGVPYNVAESCLAHLTGSKVSQAYNRSDLLEERRPVMQRWGDFVEKCLNSKN